VVASYLLGKRTRQAAQIDRAVSQLVARDGLEPLRTELRTVFGEIATRLGGLERLHHDRLPAGNRADFVRTLRRETLLASNATWRALAIALHEAKQAGIDPITAIERLKDDRTITWTRDAPFFRGSLLEIDPETGQLTGKLFSSRESIDSAATKLLAAMLDQAEAEQVGAN